MNISTLLSKFKPKEQRPYLLTGKYDLCYYIDPSSALDRHIIVNGILDDWIATHLKDLVRPTATILDIGANAGLLAVPFAKIHVPQGTVIAFEPNNDVLKQMRVNVALNDLSNVVIESIALQDDPSMTKIRFNIREALDGDGLLNKGISTIQSIALHSQGASSVTASTVDQYVRTKKVKRVDFIKIDVEGAEYRVLKGSLETIKRDRPIIHYEFSIVLDELTKSDNSSQTFELLAELGYVQYLIKEEKSLERVSRANAVTSDVNILCVPRGYKLRIS
jgi:FkbM family methyltransferase